MAFKVNGIEYYRQQTFYLSHLEAVIMFFFLGGVDNVFCVHSPTKWHDNLSAQRQLSVSSLGKVSDISYGEPRGLGCWTGTSEGHLPHRKGDCFHVHDS